MTLRDKVKSVADIDYRLYHGSPVTQEEQERFDQVVAEVIAADPKTTCWTLKLWAAFASKDVCRASGR